jgi:hypothetical protein
MNKKDILLGGVFGGMSIYILPMFIRQKWLSVITKPLGIFIMATGVILFIAWDVIVEKLTNTNLSSKKEKDLDIQYKKGLLSIDEYYKKKKTILNNQVITNKKLLALEKQKQEISTLTKKIKSTNTSKKKKINLGGILGSDNKTKSKPLIDLDNLSGFMGSSKPKINYEDEMKQVRLEREQLRNQQMKEKLTKKKKTEKPGILW